MVVGLLIFIAVMLFIIAVNTKLGSDLFRLVGTFVLYVSIALAVVGILAGIGYSLWQNFPGFWVALSTGGKWTTVVSPLLALAAFGFYDHGMKPQIEDFKREFNKGEVSKNDSNSSPAVPIGTTPTSSRHNR